MTAPMESVLSAVRRGDPVVLLNSGAEDTGGALVMAAEMVTTAHVSFFLQQTSGLICAPLRAERARELDLRPMVPGGDGVFSQSVLVSVDYLHGTTTGISASDRAATIRALVTPDTVASDFARPGHIFPLAASEGGVLRTGTAIEGVVDLMALAGCYPAGVYCQITSTNHREMAFGRELEVVADRESLLTCTVADVAKFRLRDEKIVHRVSEAPVSTAEGDWTCVTYELDHSAGRHLALVKGVLDRATPVPVSIHHECLLGDVFHAQGCNCGVQLHRAGREIEARGQGVIVYLRADDGRHSGPVGHPESPALLKGLDDRNNPGASSVAVTAQILRDLGIELVEACFPGDRSVAGLVDYGITARAN